MTTVYNQHTVTAISIGETGHQHVRDANAKGEEPTAIDCDVCVPFLAKNGWVFDPSRVPLTAAQQARKEQVEIEGNLAVKQMSEAMARAAAQALSGAVEESDAEESPAPSKRRGRPPKSRS